MAWETSTVAPISMAERIEMMKKTISNPVPTPASHHEGIDSRDHGLQQILADDRRRQRQHTALRHRLVLRLNQLGWHVRSEKRPGFDLSGIKHALDCRVHVPSHDS